MLCIGRARHPGLGKPSAPLGISIEFLNVGGWLSGGDLALDSQADFSAVAEHRLVPARARNVTTQLRQAGISSVRAPSCQDVTPGRHAGIGVVSRSSAPLSLLTIITPSFEVCVRLGRALTVLPLGNGGVAHLFVIYGYQGAENDPDKLALADQLLTSVLAKTKMCCSGQPVMLVGDLDADPLVIPSLTNGVADGAWIGVELAVANWPWSISCTHLSDSIRRGPRHQAGFCCCLLHCIGGCHCMPGLTGPLVLTSFSGPH